MILHLLISHEGEPGKIWVIIRKSRKRIVISFINLIDQIDSLWNASKNQVLIKPSISIKIPKYKEKMEWFAASPEWGVEANYLPNQNQKDRNSLTMELFIPALPLWTALWCDLE